MLDKTGFFMQFIRLAGPFWHSENKDVVRKLTLSLTALTVMQIAVAVLITEWSAGLFNALDQHSMADLIKYVGLIVLIFAANMAITVTHLKVKRRLQRDWREWLTDHLIKRWMTDSRHYLVTHIQKGAHDNPDGRIAEDIRIATEYAIDLSHSLFYCLLLLISFTKILWTLSGVVVLDLLVVEIPVYGHLVWLALFYAATASALGWLIGRPLIKATDARQTMEANFRFRLVRERENSLAIALAHGEQKEQMRLRTLFQDIMQAWDRQTQAWANIQLFTSGYSVLSMAFPILVSSPRYITGSISLGALMQSAQSFQQMAAALSWPVDNMARVAEWRASVERVLGLVEALDHLEQEIASGDPRRIQRCQSDNDRIRIDDLSIIRLDGIVVVSDLNEEIRPGERILITGNAFSGSKLFKAIVGLWPWGTGRIELPDGDTVFFMPPRPYLPSGTLRAAICYPSPPEAFDQDQLARALVTAGLQEFEAQLDQIDHWETALSREQQQRFGMVRLLMYQPKWILMENSFDSLDPEGEIAILRLICEKLPDAAMMSITNEPEAKAFFQRAINL
ncbi:MAG: ABC transporter ATP-binding protein/permease [Methylomicrobium sp.]